MKRLFGSETRNINSAHFHVSFHLADYEPLSLREPHAGALDPEGQCNSQRCGPRSSRHDTLKAGFAQNGSELAVFRRKGVFSGRLPSIFPGRLVCLPKNAVPKTNRFAIPHYRIADIWL